jgi:hypothetical protein
VPYATPAELKTRYTKVDLIDTTVQTYLDEGNNYINSRLAVSYSVPFEIVPLTVKYLEIDYAFAKILMRPKGDGNSESSNGEQMLERIHNDLSDIVNGIMPLIDSNGGFVTRKRRAVRSSVTEDPVFSLEDEY